jgi:hypothetical protein
MAEDNDGRRWELTVRGLKRQRRHRFPSGVAVAPAARVDRRQGGWGALSMLLVSKKGSGEKNLGQRWLAPFNGGVVEQWGGVGLGVVPRGGGGRGGACGSVGRQWPDPDG